tara:strand:+ start:6496 stop:6930 length:435 start_codon:yes stop_codon:yes gene_type:complete
MPIVDLEFEAPLNVSCQIGDTAYYVDTTAVFTSNQTVNSGVLGGLEVSQNSVTPQFVGIIQDIQNARNRPPYDPTDNPAPFITVDTALSSTLFNDHTAFIFFSKDNKANLSTILGYYADIQFKNNAKDYAEVFQVGMDVFESSK